MTVGMHKRPVSLANSLYRPFYHVIRVSKLAWLESAVWRWGIIMMMAESMLFV